MEYQSSGTLDNNVYKNTNCTEKCYNLNVIYSMHFKAYNLQAKSIQCTLRATTCKRNVFNILVYLQQ